MIIRKIVIFDHTIFPTTISAKANEDSNINKTAGISTIFDSLYKNIEINIIKNSGREVTNIISERSINVTVINTAIKSNWNKSKIFFVLIFFTFI